MGALLIVRAEVAALEDIEAFDAWYQRYHLSDALAAFGARTAWRGWSDVQPNVHYALYRFECLGEARRVADSMTIRALIAEFDATWGERVTRTRDIVAEAQRLEIQ